MTDTESTALSEWGKHVAGELLYLLVTRVDPSERARVAAAIGIAACDKELDVVYAHTNRCEGTSS